MTAAGLASVVAVAGGLIIGTVADAIPQRVVPQAGEYSILTGDFHVHAFPGDGLLSPPELRREARRAGLDVIAVTNHTGTLAARLTKQRDDGQGPIVIVGQEVTNARYHLIAAGISRPINADQPTEAAVADIHAQGGVAIAAHPGSIYWPAYERALDSLDGTETAHPQMHLDAASRRDFPAFRERAVRRNPDVAPIGSSDFHGSPALGRCRTYLLVRERTEAGVLDAIRNGRTVAVDRDGALYGAPALVRIVEAHRPEHRRDGELWRRVSVTLVWAGLIGLVFFRAT